VTIGYELLGYAGYPANEYFRLGLSNITNANNCRDIYYAKYYGKGEGGWGKWPAGENNKN